MFGAFGLRAIQRRERLVLTALSTRSPGGYFPSRFHAAKGFVVRLTEDQITLLDQSLGKHVVVEGDRSGGHVSSKAILEKGLAFQARFLSGRALDKCGQATKGAWGMSWRQKALKGVEDCEKLGGVVKQMLIPRSLN